MRDFVHLHLHTEYSLLDGACRLRDIAKVAREVGQSAVAITDHGNMFGAVEFYKALKKEDVKPIIGCEVYVASRGLSDKVNELDSENYHLVLLCKNQEGYKNLIKMVSIGYTDGFYNKPRIDIDLLKKHSGGLVCLSGCIAGKIPQLILSENYTEAVNTAIMLRDIFEQDSFYLEVQQHGIPEQSEVNKALLKMSRQLNIGLVATNDVHYLRKSDEKMHDVLLCVQTARVVEDTDRMKFPSPEFYLKSYDEMAEHFEKYDNALENTVKIAEMCNFDFDFSKTFLPTFPLPVGENSPLEYLKKLCYQGLIRCYGDLRHEQRLEYELSVISDMGFVDYFLIVSDFIMYAKDKGIAVGPGRGSAAGSIVSYSLGITDVDPIKYNLYFERFLNPERVSMPDIDIDFCYIRRQEVIDYVTQKYGQDCVAQIITFGTMAARGAIRDVGRVLGMSYAEVDLIAKLIPQELKMTLDKALEVSSDLRRFYENEPQIKNLIDMARELEGMPRNSSTHAAGVIITSLPTYNYVPLAKNDNLTVTQYTMNTLEEIGLLKMDFLALRNLTILVDAVNLINSTREVKLDLSKISDDDQDVYAMLGQGKTSGVFQLESAGMTSVAVGLKPHNIEDITALIALYRPGPMQFIPKYIESKHNPQKVSYKHERLKEILDVTYGCMVYQEQVIEIFRRLAGYSLGKADMVRRAISKKKFDILNKERQSFIFGNEQEGISGCTSNGISEKIANEIFDEILDFADYAFNKAHSVCYAVLAYQTAFVKYHYPKEYMAALLNSVSGANEKVAQYISQCKELGVKVLVPHINYSGTHFTVAGNDIRFGLAAVKNVGVGVTENIVKERTLNGNFMGLEDFCSRMTPYDLNKRTLENLIRCGAFDCMGHKRSQLLAVYEKVLENASFSNKKNVSGQLDLFGELTTGRDELQMPNLPEFNEGELFKMEKETTGLYLSGHPLEQFSSLDKRVMPVKIGGIVALGDSENEREALCKDGDYVTVTAVVSASKIKTTKNGTNIAYVTLEDMSGDIEAMAFSNVIKEFGAYMQENTVVIAHGRVSVREDEMPKIMISTLYPYTEEFVTIHEEKNKRRYPQKSKEYQKNIQLPSMSLEIPKTLYIYIEQEKTPLTKKIQEILLESKGDTCVIMESKSTGKKYKLPSEYNVKADKALFDSLEAIMPKCDIALCKGRVK